MCMLLHRLGYPRRYPRRMNKNNKQKNLNYRNETLTKMNCKDIRIFNFEK